MTGLPLFAQIEDMGVLEPMASYRERLLDVLSGDLDFHDKDSRYASHNFHAFPAKFPPQLPRAFINALTEPGDVVLDPMMGSGTTIVEALLAGRCGIGFDIDPLALRISGVKTAPLDVEKLARIGVSVIEHTRLAIKDRSDDLRQNLGHLWDKRTYEFVNYWFAPETQVELLALITEIQKIEDPQYRAFFELVFSAIIITKSGGVSLAFDLAHTRPHRAKGMVNQAGEVVWGKKPVEDSSQRARFQIKVQRSALEEFEKRFKNNVKDAFAYAPSGTLAGIVLGNAQSMPLREASVDLIVTSPPYASNAIDYMRAHKFSLVWMNHSIQQLSQKRAEYIGGETVNGFAFESMPPAVIRVVDDIAKLDEKKAQVLYRYYSEMTRVLQQMYRVLKPGKAAIVVVGSSVMRGCDTETHECLAEIGRALGFDVPKIGVRQLDRDRRMMPAGNYLNLESQIQQRMHEEYVIGFYKPEYPIAKAGGLT
jgi:DNA modification methylase